MKVLKRNYEHRNLILFLIFSLIYLQAIYSLSKGQTLLAISSLESFLNEHYIILILTLVTIFMVLNVKRHSDKFLLLCLTVITGKNFVMLASSFNKLILGLNFIYLIFAFYFFVTWELEIAKASYNPFFSANDLEKESRLHLKGKLENTDTNESYNVFVTNIDDNSCFTLLSQEDAKRIIPLLNPKGNYRLSTEYEGVYFSQAAELTSTYDCGIGLNLLNEKKDYTVLNWSDLYKVCLERGLFQ